MQIQGNHIFSAPRRVVWDALLDPTVLSMALPGGEQLQKVSDNEYKAVMNVKVGPVQGRFEGKVELSNIVMPDTYSMKVGGQGAPGFLNGEGNVTLSDVEGGTLMSYVGDAQVGGKIAGVGQRLIESTAKSIIKQGLAALDGQIQARVTAQPVVEAVVEAVMPAATTGSEHATTVVEQAISSAPKVADGIATSATNAFGVAPTTASPTPSQSASPVAPRSVSAAPSISPTKIALEVVKDVSRDLLSDVIPLKNQEKTLWFTVGAVAMLLFVLLVRLVA